VIAALAGRQDAVVRVRESVLGNKLLSHSELRKWLDGRLMEDRRNNAEVTATEPPALLEWLPPDSSFVESVPIPIQGGTLDQVKWTAGVLKIAYLWPEAQAVVFLLTGLVPVIHTARVGLVKTWNVPALTRIKLDLDPALRPSEVSRLYSAVKSRIVQKQRERTLSPKHLELAAFAAENGVGKTYSQLRELWNAECRRRHRPDWAYRGSVPHFGKDCKRAQDRLLSLDGKAGKR
jgi:hypothetical protein